jgi:hypothetical protein
VVCYAEKGPCRCVKVMKPGMGDDRPRGPWGTVAGFGRRKGERDAAEGEIRYQAWEGLDGQLLALDVGAY